jgi:HSP20 family protein
MALEYMKDGSLVIQADLPGLDPDRDIAISIAHDVLHIRAHDHGDSASVDRISDLRNGVYERDIALPPGSAEDQVSARYHNDQLEVRTPIGSIAAAMSVSVPIESD